MQAISPQSGEHSRPTGKFWEFENYFQAIERRPSRIIHLSSIALYLSLFDPKQFLNYCPPLDRNLSNKFTRFNRRITQ